MGTLISEKYKGKYKQLKERERIVALNKRLKEVFPKKLKIPKQPKRPR